MGFESTRQVNQKKSGTLGFSTLRLAPSWWASVQDKKVTSGDEIMDFLTSASHPGLPEIKLC